MDGSTYGRAPGRGGNRREVSGERVPRACDTTRGYKRSRGEEGNRGDVNGREGTEYRASNIVDNMGKVGKIMVGVRRGKTRRKEGLYGTDRNPQLSLYGK